MYSEVNGVTLYYEKIGDGEPILLVHGNSEDHSIFDVLSQQLGGNYSVYMPDSRCHGKSSRCNSLSYMDIATDMAEFIKTVIGEKTIFYGFSDGGIIGLLLAIYYPETVKNVIISGANTKPSGLLLPVQISFFMGSIFSRDPKVKMMVKEPNITKEQLNSITVPVHVLAGSRDIIKESDTRFIAKNIPDSTLEILKGENHSSYIVHSIKLFDILQKYL